MKNCSFSVNAEGLGSSFKISFNQLQNFAFSPSTLYITTTQTGKLLLRYVRDREKDDLIVKGGGIVFSAAL